MTWKQAGGGLDIQSDRYRKDEWFWMGVWMERGKCRRSSWSPFVSPNDLFLNQKKVRSSKYLSGDYFLDSEWIIVRGRSKDALACANGETSNWADSDKENGWEIADRIVEQQGEGWGLHISRCFHQRGLAFVQVCTGIQIRVLCWFRNSPERS